MVFKEIFCRKRKTFSQNLYLDLSKKHFKFKFFFDRIVDNMVNKIFYNKMENELL